MQDESFVQQTSTYHALQRQLQSQSAEFDKARRLLEAAQRECEGCKHSVQGLMHQVSVS